MILNQDLIANVINSDHNFILLDTNMEITNECKLDNKNLCSTSIPEYEIKNATDDEWDNLIMNLGNIDWEKKININTNVDNIADFLLNNIEDQVKMNLRKKVNFKDKTKSNGEQFRSNILIPREVRIYSRRKTEGHKKNL